MKTKKATPVAKSTWRAPLKLSVRFFCSFLASESLSSADEHLAVTSELVGPPFRQLTANPYRLVSFSFFCPLFRFLHASLRSGHSCVGEEGNKTITLSVRRVRRTVRRQAVAFIG